MSYGMDDRVGVGEIGDRFADLAVGGGNSKDSIVQVMKAVEAAESTIKMQLEENNRLKEELERRTEELQQYKLDAVRTYMPSVDSRKENIGSEDSRMCQVELRQNMPQLLENNSTLDSMNMMVLHRNGLLKNGTAYQNWAGGEHYFDNKGNGSSKVLPSGHANSYNPGMSQFSSSSSRSISPIRIQKGDFDAVANLNGQTQLQMPEINNSSSLLKQTKMQDMILKIREHEEEILQLRRHLADYSTKEANILNEKYVLEKRIAHMRMAFDQQQQELVDAASKALSYRQDIIEENIRLTYSLQSAQQERATFVSSLLPLLSEYDYQPQTSDAHSIVSNLKILFRHLHEKLVNAEEKLKEMQYQIAPWHAEALTSSNLAPQSPVHTFGAMKNGMELVPQPIYSHAHSPISSPFNAPTRSNWEPIGLQTIQANPHIFSAKINTGTMAAKGIPVSEETPPIVDGAQGEPQVGFSSEAKNANLSFKDLSGIKEMDGLEVSGAQPVGESSAQWGSGSPYMASGLDDPNTSYPFLPPVLEEPSSSFSEAAEDDPLPAIDGLQISGEAFPGRELQACGYSINGTTSCNFEWVRYREDGSVNYIEDAKQPAYLVTADDVDCYLAIQVQPLDDRKRKGKLVEVFANEHRKIPCDPEMQEQIEKILSIGSGSFDVSIAAGVGNIWEHATLGIKTEGYNIKCSGPRGVVVMEKFSPNVEIVIPFQYPTQFSIRTSGGVDYILMSSTSISNRDTIVLTMRLFKKRALEKRSRRRTRFFK